MTTNTRVLIRNLPKEKLAVTDYEVTEAPVPAPGNGEVLCQTLAIGVGAGARAGLQGSASYAGAPQTGIVMNAQTVSRVVESRAPGFVAGDLVICGSGWQAYASHPEKTLTKVPAIEDPAHYVGALGTNGLTAYFGLLRCGEPKAGETVVVSAAAGSVGHLVGQIAKLKGCRVVGVCGSDEKGARLVADLGFDATVNYKDGDFRAALKAACPDGIDVYFDNTGGDVLGAVLFRMNTFGRIACCGVVSQYDTSNPAGGPRGVPGLLVNKRIRMQGFLVFDYVADYANARETMLGWIRTGALRAEQDEYQGLAQAPAAFVDLLAGGNFGTRIVRVAR
ncbi:MAG: NADP-dependent oxidoreductase [Gammaproteobacteria bacterium]|nr:NADP-dependent oxidoreductase [Gammaproteobacteria bacterium]